MPTDLNDIAQIEDLLATYVRSMDCNIADTIEKNKNIWLSCFSEELLNYHIDEVGIRGLREKMDIATVGNKTAVIVILWLMKRERPSLFHGWKPILRNYIKRFKNDMTVKQRLAEMSGMMIFDRIMKSQSQLYDIKVVVSENGLSATAEDYFSHWEKVNPSHLTNIIQFKNGNKWYYHEGKHKYDLTKENGFWKITKFNGELFKSKTCFRSNR